MLARLSGWIAVCGFGGGFGVWFGGDTVALAFGSYIQLDCGGYVLSDTFCRIRIELLVFGLCLVFSGSSFSKLSSGCSS